MAEFGWANTIQSASKDIGGRPLGWGGVGWGGGLHRLDSFPLADVIVTMHSLVKIGEHPLDCVCSISV